jgi:hypothetical protein
VYRGCGAYTHPRNGKGDAYGYCKRCHPGAIERKWTRDLVLARMLDWLNKYGRLPSSYDWSRTHAQRRGGSALKRLNPGEWPSATVVGHVFGSLEEAREAASTEARKRSLARSRDTPASTSPLIGARVSTHEQCPS